jgi:hypothetical protein
MGDNAAKTKPSIKEFSILSMLLTADPAEFEFPEQSRGEFGTCGTRGTRLSPEDKTKKSLTWRNFFG